MEFGNRLTTLMLGDQGKNREYGESSNKGDLWCRLGRSDSFKVPTLRELIWGPCEMARAKGYLKAVWLQESTYGWIQPRLLVNFSGISRLSFPFGSDVMRDSLISPRDRSQEMSGLRVFWLQWRVNVGDPQRCTNANGVDDTDSALGRKSSFPVI